MAQESKKPWEINHKPYWTTPDNIFGPANDRWHFNLDVCASRELGNAKCQHAYFEGEQDGLDEDWGKVHFDCTRAWCNPPLGPGQIIQWATKAVEQTGPSASPVFTVLLLPNDPSTKWWRYLYESRYCHEIILIPRRIKFIPPPGIKASSNSITSAFYVIRPEQRWTPGPLLSVWPGKEGM